MSISINSNEPKKFPLQGMGEYFEKLGKLEHAKHAYTKAIDSPLASATDKKNAKSSLDKVEAKLRGKSEVVDVEAAVYLPVDTLTPHPDAEMEMGSQDYARLVKDIRERGIKVPLAVDTQNRIVCGVHRWKAAKEIGLEQVRCFVVGITSPNDVKRYAIADNVCRRQLSPKEKKAWAVELLRLRQGIETVRGRKKGGKRVEGDAPSNRKIAEATGLDRKTVDKLEASTGPNGPVSKIAKKSLIQRENLKDSIVKGKSKERDSNFVDYFFEKAEERANWILNNLKKGEKLTISVDFEYSEGDRDENNISAYSGGDVSGSFQLHRDPS